MPALYLLRHGETDWNRDGRIQGWAYTRLNDIGRQQAAAAGAYLAQETPPVDLLYTSDLPRATETCSILQEEPAMSSCPVVTKRAFRERNFGVYQGFASDGFFEAHPEYSVLFSGESGRQKRPELGESYAAFDQRVVDAYTEFRDVLVATDQTAVLVTHGGVIARLIAHLRDLDDATVLESVSPSNCSVTKVSLTETDAEIVYQARDSFLP